MIKVIGIENSSYETLLRFEWKSKMVTFLG